MAFTWREVSGVAKLEREKEERGVAVVDRGVLRVDMAGT